MTWHLNADISFCELDGRLFFLDIQRDRYFQLCGALERRFTRYLQAPDDESIDASELVRHNLILPSMPVPHGGAAANIAPPLQSLLETPCHDRHVALDAVRDVFLIVAMMRWQLKARRLKRILQALSAYRDTRTSAPVDDPTEYRQRLSAAAAVFVRVRPYVPIETCCLVDSLALVRFLARRGLRAHLVMGVACDPFSAHAWVQHGPLVLNETVGAALAHVPIRVI